MAIGNISHFLPAIINLVQSNNEKRLLALHALKEVASFNKIILLVSCPHSPTSSGCQQLLDSGQLENVAEMPLWVPLFERSETQRRPPARGGRLSGQLTTTNPLILAATPGGLLHL